MGGEPGARTAQRQGMPVSGDTIQVGSRAALIPIWFLAIYIIIVLLAPVTYRAWRRWGFASFWALVATGSLVDGLFFVLDIKAAGCEPVATLALIDRDVEPKVGERMDAFLGAVHARRPPATRHVPHHAPAHAAA